MKSVLLIENINESKNDENQNETNKSQIESKNLPIIEHSNYFPSENSKNKGKKNLISSENEENKTEIQNKNEYEYEYENEKKQLLNINNGTNLSLESNGIKQNYTNLIVQRGINFIIDKTFINFIENGNQTIKEKNISDKLNNQKDEDNINILDKEELEPNESIINIKKEGNKLKLLKIKQNKKWQKTSQSIDNNIKNKKAYIRKINIIKKNLKENGITKNNKNQNNLNYNSNNNGINDLNDLPISRNSIIKNKTQTQNTFSDLKKDNLKENNILLNSFSPQEIIQKNKKSNSQINHSLEMKESISFYDSLNLFNSNIKDNINNSKIRDKSYLSGIKNEDRKNSLQNALLIYNRYRNINKLEKINIFNSPVNSKKNGIISKNNALNINSKKEEEKEEEKDEENNLNIDEETESEFSFNTKLKKKEESNISNNNNNKNGQFTDIINKEFNNSNYNINIDTNDYKKNEDNNTDNFINIINYKIKDDNNNENNNDKENINNNNNKRIKPSSYFVRKLIREEHYYIDENGNEKLLEVKQEYIKDKDQKNMEAPYIKKNLNLKGNLNSSKNKENSKIEKNKLLNIKQSLNKEVKTSKEKKIEKPIDKRLKAEDKVSKENNIKTPNYKRSKKEDKISKENNIKTPNYIKLNNEDKISKENNIKTSNYIKLNNLKKNKINLIYNNSRENTNILEKRIKNTLKIFESKSPKRINKKSENNPMINNFNNFFSIKNDIKKEIKRRNTNIGYRTHNNTNSQKQLNLFDQKNDNKNSKKDFSNNIKKDRKIIIYSSNNKDIKKLPIIGLDKNNNYNPEDESSINIDESFNHLNTVTYTGNESINYKDSYIKVNKITNKNRNLNTDRYIERNTDINNDSKFIRRDLNKNHHSFHEIKIIKNKLGSNSQSNYYPNELSLDELSINLNALNTHKFLIKPINKEKNNQLLNSNKNEKIQKIYNSNLVINKQKNFSNKSNSNSYFSIKIKNNNNKINIPEKSNHKYYESKSTKKIENEGYMGRHNTHSSYLDNSNYNNLYKSNIKEKYFYQNWNIDRVLTQYNNN